MLDSDGVLSGWFPNFYPWLCEIEGWIEDHSCVHGETGWHFYREHGMSDEQFVVRLHQYAEEGGFAEQELYPGVREAVIQMHVAGHTTHVVTDRPPAAEADTAWWLHTHLPEVDSLTISRDKTVFKGYGPPTYYAIDDRHENIVAMRTAGVYAYLLDRPWNHHSDQPRVHTFQEFADIVCY